MNSGVAQGRFAKAMRRGGRAAIGVITIGALFVIFGGLEGTGPWARDVVIEYPNCPNPNARLLTTSSRKQSDPAISGDFIVFTDTRLGPPHLFYIDLSEGSNSDCHLEAQEVKDHRLTDTLEGGEEDADIFRRTVVYTQPNPETGLRDVLAAQIVSPDAAAQARIIAGDSLADQRNPAIGGNLVVWEDNRDGNTEIYARDLLSGIERRLTMTP
ncbi:MAG: hypothetical protein V3U83_08310, partial [Acidobacteriota bacterium]